MDNPQNLGILFHIQHYIDDIDVEFQGIFGLVS